MHPTLQLGSWGEAWGLLHVLSLLARVQGHTSQPETGLSLGMFSCPSPLCPEVPAPTMEGDRNGGTPSLPGPGQSGFSQET